MATLQDIKTALDTTGYNFAHYGWDCPPDGDYGVYVESGYTGIYCDNANTEYVSVSGSIYFFTRDNSSIVRNKIETALNTIPDFWFRCYSVNLDFNNGYICYEWRFKTV